jgi:hypothetical protein
MCVFVCVVPMELESESEEEKNGVAGAGAENGTTEEERSHIMEELWAEGNLLHNRTHINCLKIIL